MFDQIECTKEEYVLTDFIVVKEVYVFETVLVVLKRSMFLRFSLCKTRACFYGI